MDKFLEEYLDEKIDNRTIDSRSEVVNLLQVKIGQSIDTEILEALADEYIRIKKAISNRLVPVSLMTDWDGKGYLIPSEKGEEFEAYMSPIYEDEDYEAANSFYAEFNKYKLEGDDIQFYVAISDYEKFIR